MSKSGDVKFEAGGAEYRLRFGWGAMRKFEAISGENVLVALRALESPEKDTAKFAGRVVQLFFAAVSPALGSEDEAADLMDEIGGARAIDLIAEAAGDAFDGVQEDAAETNPTKAPKK